MNWLPTRMPTCHWGNTGTGGWYGKIGKLFILISSCCCLETGMEVSCNWFVFILRCSGQNDWMWVSFGSCPFSQPHFLSLSFCCFSQSGSTTDTRKKNLWILASFGAWHGEKATAWPIPQRDSPSTQSFSHTGTRKNRCLGQLVEEFLSCRTIKPEGS